MSRKVAVRRISAHHFGGAAHGTWFGVDLTDLRIEATDTTWSWGHGQLVQADSGSLVTLLSGRTLPDGQTLPRG